MSRELVKKIADTAAGLDVLARAQFWEGYTGSPPFSRVKGAATTRVLVDAIKKMMGEVSPELLSDIGMKDWYSFENTGLYKSVVNQANAILRNRGTSGAEVVQDNMASDKPGGSVFYAAGVKTKSGGSEKILNGVFTPTQAGYVAKGFMSGKAIDAIRTEKGRSKLTDENAGDIMVNTMDDSNYDAEDWAFIIDSIMANPEHPLAKNFINYLMDVAARTTNPRMVKYLENLLDPKNDMNDSQFAKAEGVSAAYLSVLKKKFFENVAAEIAAGKDNSIPAISNLIDDSEFLSKLNKGKVKGPYHQAAVRIASKYISSIGLKI